MNELVNILADRKKDLARKVGREVDTVEFRPGGICTSVFMNKESFVFTSHVGSESFSSKDGEEVRKWAFKELKAICDLKWIPVITVLDTGEKGGSYNWGGRELERHSISIDVDRAYVSKLPNGGVRMVKWDLPKEARLTSQDTPWNWIQVGQMDVDPDKLPAHEKNFHILPYSEEMWVALRQVAKGIDDLQRKLHELLASNEGQKKLVDMGSKMMLLLGAPNEDKEKIPSRRKASRSGEIDA